MKLLLLGTGDSGKSTLFKQLVHLYGKDYDADARSRYVKTIHSNTLQSMKKIAKQSAILADQKLPPVPAYALGTGLAAPDARGANGSVTGSVAAGAGDGAAPAAAAGPDVAMVQISTAMQSGAAVQAAKALEEAKYDTMIDSALGAAIKTLWADPGIRQTYAHRGGMYQCMHACGYFFDRLDAITDAHYLPTYADILHARARTTGIVETQFAVGDYQFRLLDVGGQRNERRKWIHCFEKVTALLFVTAISEYDEVLYEDHTVNRMVESINLFAEICASKWFTNTNIVLFLNKSDLFREKIKTVDLTCVFPEYTGGCDYDKALEYIRDTFLKQNVNPNRRVYTQVSCATDTNNVSFTFNSVKDTIVNNKAGEAGFKLS